MWEEAVFDRGILRAVRREVSDPDFKVQFIRQSLQVFLQNVFRRAVAAATVTQNQQFRGLRIVSLPLFVPSQTNAVAAECGGVVAGVQFSEP